MDLDSLAKQFDDLKRRVEPLLDEYESAMAGRSGRGPFGRHKHSEAQRHLEDGNLEAASQATGIERAHNGDEPDESFERRLRAFVYGAEKADAVKPRPAAVADEGGADDSAADIAGSGAGAKDSVFNGAGGTGGADATG